MVDSNDSFLREVKEEIDRERLENIWKRYGTLIFAAGAVVIASVAGFQIWSWSAKSAAERAGADYQKALQSVFDSKLDDASGVFAELSKDAPTGYATLAELQLAATLVEQGKKAEALKKFDELSKRSAVDSLLRGFSALQAASLRLGEADFTEMQNRLNDLVRAGSPWRFNAHELLGMAALRAGKLDEARSSFTTILGDNDAPPAMRQRAEFRMAQVAASEGETKTDTVKGDAAKSVGSENTKSEATKSEAAKPKVTKPEAATAEPTKSEAAKPEATKPEAAKPEATKPEAAKSGEPADANK
jgi:hypothetical protein